MVIKNPKIRKGVYLVLAVALGVLLVTGKITKEQLDALPAQALTVATVAGLIMAALNAPKSDSGT